MADEPLGKAIRTYIFTKVKELGEWVKPEPNDSIPLQVVKIMYKSVVVLLLMALSPVVLLFLIISFVGGF